MNLERINLIESQKQEVIDNINILLEDKNNISEKQDDYQRNKLIWAESALGILTSAVLNYKLFSVELMNEIKNLLEDVNNSGGEKENINLDEIEIVLKKAKDKLN